MDAILQDIEKCKQSKKRGGAQNNFNPRCKIKELEEN